MQLNKYIEKLARGFYHRNAFFGKYQSVNLDRYTNGKLIYKKDVENLNLEQHIEKPTHLRLLFAMPTVRQRAPGIPRYDHEKSISIERCLLCNDESGCGSAQDDEEFDEAVRLPIFAHSKEAFEEALQEASEMEWTSKGLSEHEPTQEEDGLEKEGKEGVDNVFKALGDKEEEDSADEKNLLLRGREIREYEEAVHILQNCSMCVGMHPDQGAEHLIDFCLLNKKPFATVICCVYSNQFPYRRILKRNSKDKEGEQEEEMIHVSRFEDFIEYLMMKDAGKIHAIRLDFDGKNIMLFHLGGRQPLADPFEVVPHRSLGRYVPE
jgi:hypothetical protein